MPFRGCRLRTGRHSQVCASRTRHRRPRRLYEVLTQLGNSRDEAHMKRAGWRESRAMRAILKCLSQRSPLQTDRHRSCISGSVQDERAAWESKYTRALNMIFWVLAVGENRALDLRSSSRARDVFTDRKVRGALFFGQSGSGPVAPSMLGTTDASVSFYGGLISSMRARSTPLA